MHSATSKISDAKTESAKTENPFSLLYFICLGLGDFRIPKEALSAPNGTVLDPSQVYKYKANHKVKIEQLEKVPFGNKKN